MGACMKCGKLDVTWSHIENCTEGFIVSPCLSCASLRARIEVLEKVVQWAIEASLQVSKDIDAGMVEQFSNELRRKVKKG